MARSCLLGLVFFALAAGCSRVDRNGIMSQELPLTVTDLAEIRAGERNYQEVLLEYKIYDSPRLAAYLNAIAAAVAAVSTRPALPYKIIILDDEEVNMFGGPGGFIYVTTGLLKFVQSEAEIAGLIAHEIAHVSHYDYSNVPHLSKMQTVYKGLLRGSELARDSIGTYGTAAYYGVKGIGKVAPYLGGKFASDQEIIADEIAVKYLLEAGYDPNGLQNIVERLAKVNKEDVGRFVIFMDVHPPFQDRREILEERLLDLDPMQGDVEFKKDTLSDMRQIMVNTPDSILFQPKFNFSTHNADPWIEDDMRSKNSLKQAGYRRRSWL